VIKLIEGDRFLVIIEKASQNYSAYSPDLPGCVATGKTQQQAARLSISGTQRISTTTQIVRWRNWI
jgi:hypothetical protein